MAQEESQPASDADVTAANALREKRIANLKPRKPGDPPLNPLGINGREGAEAWRKFLDKPDPDEPSLESRRAVMHETLYRLIKKGKIGPLQIGIEQDQGKPPQSIDHKVSMSATKADEVAAAALAQLESGAADDGDSPA